MKEFTFTGYDSIELYGRWWEVDFPHAVLLIVHGFGEHSGRYDDLAASLNSKNIAVVSFDNRGHGRSGGKRGHVMAWGEYREDVKAAIGEVTKRYPTIPFFLMGHSVGGTIALDYLLSETETPRGAIISAPALGTPGVSPLKQVLARLMSGIAPAMTFSVGLDEKRLSRNPQVGEAYISDPLVHSYATPRLSTELKGVQERILERAPSLSCPMLMVFGSDDTIVPPEATERFFELAGGDDKFMQVFEGGYHELHNDIVKEDVYSLYSEWILARI